MWGANIENSVSKFSDRVQNMRSLKHGGEAPFLNECTIRNLDTLVDAILPV